MKYKRDLKLATSWLQKSSENSFISDILPGQVSWCKVKQFFSYFKSYICYIINYPNFICPFEFGKDGKEGKKFLKKLEYLKNKKSFNYFDNNSDILKNFLFKLWSCLSKKWLLWYNIRQNSFLVDNLNGHLIDNSTQIYLRKGIYNLLIIYYNLKAIYLLVYQVNKPDFIISQKTLIVEFLAQT